MRFTVITVCYNSAASIRDTISSVLAQTYANVEYIIVDGGSTDGTQTILQEYEPGFGPRVRWISERDKGMYDAMNKGIAMATGEIIGILNSDDWYDPEAIATVAANYSERVDIYFGEIYRVRAVRGKRYRKRETPLSLQAFPRRMAVLHPSTFVRRDWYGRVPLFDARLQSAADYEFMARSYLAGAVFRSISAPLVYMREGGRSSVPAVLEEARVRKHLTGRYALGECTRVCLQYALQRSRYVTLQSLLPAPLFERVLMRRGWEQLDGVAHSA